MSSPRRVQVLYAEDSLSDADLTRERLAREANAFEMTLADTGERCLSLLEGGGFDVLLLDQRLPDMDGLEVLRRMRSRSPGVPVVMVTGVGDEELAVRALQFGAADYLPKRGDYLEELPAVLTRVLAERSGVPGGPLCAAPRSARILYVEHHAMDVDLTVQHFRDVAPHLEVEAVPTGEAALARMGRAPALDLVLCDLRLTDMSGLELLRIARRRGGAPPFLVISGQGDEETAVAALKLGAYDYILKRPGYLPHVVWAIEHALDRHELEDANRRLLDEMAERQRAEAERSRLAEEELRAKARIASILESVSDAFVALDREWRYAHVNEHAAALFGKRVDELVGRQIWTLYPEGVDQPFAKAYRKAMAERVPVFIEDCYQPWDRWFENRIFPSPEGISIFFHEITDRKRAERRLVESEERLRLAAEAANVGLWSWDLVTNRVYYSPEWKRQLGYDEHEIADRFEEWQGRLHPEDRHAALERVRAFLERPEGKLENEFRLRHRDGSYRWIYTEARVYRDGEGRPVRMLGSHIDVTERKRSERRLHDLAARLQSIREEEAARIAREIHDEPGQNLTALKLDLSWLRRELVKSSGGAATTRLVERLDAMSQLVDETVRTIQRISEELRPAALDKLGLAEAIGASIADFRKRTGLDVSLECGLSEDAIARDLATAVYRIFQELMTNVARHAAARRVRVVLRFDDGSLLLEVVDDGRGITPEEVADAKSLGLAGVRERVLMFGGRAEFSGAAGAGTRAAVHLPVAEGRPA